jgi:hypothetical protein
MDTRKTRGGKVLDKLEMRRKRKKVAKERETEGLDLVSSSPFLMSFLSLRTSLIVLVNAVETAVTALQLEVVSVAVFGTRTFRSQLSLFLLLLLQLSGEERGDEYCKVLSR